MNAREFVERGLLGTLLQRPGRVRAVTGWLRPSDFRTPANRHVFGALQTMVAEYDDAHPHEPRGDVVPGVDAVSVWDRIFHSGERGSHAITGPALHALIATAPDVATAQPEVYARYVLEASVRRDVERTGMRVGRLADAHPDLDRLLEIVEEALHDVETAHDRWNAALPGQASATLNAPAAAGRGDVPDLQMEAPDPETVRQAELALVGQVLNHPALLDEFGDTLRPEDFLQPEAGNTFRAAQEVHAARAVGGRVDPITVVWRQQQNTAQYGAGLTPKQVLDAAQNPPSPDPHWSAQMVMGASLSRLTSRAAEAVQRAAQHPGLAPADMLHTTRMTLTAVQETAHRMSGRSSSAALAAQGNPVPITTALRQHTTSDRRAAPTTATAPERPSPHAEPGR
jgi:replicative DNA helicase